MRADIRYRKLGFVELNVSDLSRSRDFYEGLVGLAFAGEGPRGELRFRCDDDPYNVVLHRGPKPGHKRAGWMLEDASQFDHLAASLKRSDVPYEELSAGECGEREFGRAIRIVEPNAGATVEFYVNAAPERHYAFAPTVAKIQRLGHVVYGAPDLAAMVAFYRDVLNFAESDTIDGAFTFMRPFPSPYHHGLGLGRMDQTRYHHTNFMVTEADDIGKAIHRMNKAGVPIVHGPGRHPASGSMFLYFLDPDGITVEYSFGMEEFSEDIPRPARLMPRKPGIGDYWGSPTDPRMAATGDIEPYPIQRAA